MKTLSLIRYSLSLILPMFWLQLIFGQSNINPTPLQISNHQTTHLVFPINILSVDRGSESILAQKVTTLGNILQLKAASDSLPPTNLTVFTEDGRLYSFAISYDSLPAQLTYVFKDTIDSIVPAGLADTGRLQISKTATLLANKISGYHGIGDRQFGMSMIVKGIYIQKDIIYLVLSLKNRTYIGFDADNFRISIRDKKQGKRTAIQENEITPVLIHGNIQSIPGQSIHTVVIAVPKFTIPDKKLLYLQLMERNGGRHLRIRLSNKTLTKARPV